MIDIYTVQLSQWRKLKEEDIPVIDITAKGKLYCFAPEYDLVRQYKQRLISDELYAHLYKTKMRWSYKEHRDEWVKLTTYPKLALACYCKPNHFCHRLIFKDLFIKHLQKENIPYTDHGEYK